MKWLVALAVMLVTGSAAAQSASPVLCMARMEVITQLADRYNEFPVSRGRATNGAMVEVFTSDRGDTWTLVITMPNGLTCVVAEGKGWHTNPHPGQEVDDRG